VHHTFVYVVYLSIAQVVMVSVAQVLRSTATPQHRQQPDQTRSDFSRSSLLPQRDNAAAVFGTVDLAADKLDAVFLFINFKYQTFNMFRFTCFMFSI